LSGEKGLVRFRIERKSKKSKKKSVKVPVSSSERWDSKRTTGEEAKKKKREGLHKRPLPRIPWLKGKVRLGIGE